MDGKKGESNNPHIISELFKKTLEQANIALYSETHTLPGKANIFFDIILAILILFAIVMGSTVVEIIKIVLLALHPELVENVEESSIIPQLLLFAGFSFLCLIFMAIVEKEWKKRKKEKESH